MAVGCVQFDALKVNSFHGTCSDGGGVWRGCCIERQAMKSSFRCQRQTSQLHVFIMHVNGKNETSRSPTLIIQVIHKEMNIFIEYHHQRAHSPLTNKTGQPG